MMMSMMSMTILQLAPPSSQVSKSVLRAETLGLWSWAASSEKALLAIGILMKRWALAGGNYFEDHDVRMTLPSRIIIIIIIIIISSGLARLTESPPGPCLELRTGK